MMEDFILNCFIWLAGFGTGWYVREFLAFRNVRKHMKVMSETIADNYIPIKIELDGGHIYVYNKDTSEYLASGPTMESLEKKLAAKYPGKLFSASTEDLLKLQK
jgi:hypothetical protein